MSYGERRSRRLVAAFWAAASILALAAAPADAQPAAGASAAYPEAEVKAAFLLGFAGYVQWPAAETGARTGPIRFAVLNAPRVEAALERLAQGRSVQGRSVRVRALGSIDELDGDEVLFIGPNENWRLPQQIAAVEGPTLVVTDAPDGLAAGAMINFQLVDRRVRFEVGLPAAHEAGLSLSSRLLAAALRVETSRCWAGCRRGTLGRAALLARHGPTRPGPIVQPRAAA